ncbi:c-type cytochrome biogenesis protein CcmI [Roseomonas rosulenta]|uniref:c-type cytochrome biogenesis protein CcmI n=1 Tax=Roseomonas rosulenta TaxID=2748667 RepID=UPI0018DEF0A2|nr:c-type cytochrome biogenesis protein CcmI [Roseomonas rosulenta]
MTTWIPLVLLALAALLPLGAAVLRPSAARGRREADVALYRAQLDELDREREVGRLDEAGHRAARIEVQRRLIAAADQAEEATTARSPALLVAILPLLAAAGVGIYLLRGSPGMPSAPYDLRAAAAARDDQVLATLRDRLAALDPRSDQARQGWILLGNAERGRGNAEAAIAAWTRALDARFEADLAGDVAEMEIARGAPAAAAPWLTRALADQPGDPRFRFLAGLVEAESGRPANARSLWQALLAETPPDAPWRGLLERRLSALP